MFVIDMTEKWIGGVSDGIDVNCSICGLVPKFDYTVSDYLWSKYVESKYKTGVICIHCFLELIPKDLLYEICFS